MRVLFKVFCSSLLVLILSASPLYALILGSVTGEWINPEGGYQPALSYSDGAVSYGSGIENRVWFGVAANSEQSGLGFTGVGTPYAFESGDVFKLGRLRHLNSPTLIGSSITGVDLLVSMSFIDPEGLAGQVGFTLSLTNTPNINSVSDDFVFFPTSFAPVVFGTDSVWYTFELLGLGPDPYNLVSSLQTPEGSLNNTYLWGRITAGDAVKPVPEPVMLILFGSGFLVLAGARIRAKG
ncbi:MAG: choice-of-anchor K domain-containing protein [Desulfomonilia bacterium]